MKKLLIIQIILFLFLTSAGCTKNNIDNSCSIDNRCIEYIVNEGSYKNKDIEWRVHVLPDVKDGKITNLGSVLVACDEPYFHQDDNVAINYDEDKKQYEVSVSTTIFFKSSKKYDSLIKNHFNYSGIDYTKRCEYHFYLPENISAIYAQ